MIRRFKKTLVELLACAMPFVCSINNVARAEEGTNIVKTVNTNMTTTLNWKDQYFVKASSAGNGSVAGDTNNWVDEGGNATLSANPNSHYVFNYFANVPAVGGTTTNNPYTFTVNGAWTNILAYFREKTNNWQDIGFSSINVSGNNVSLEIPNTFTDSLYHVYSKTNLYSDWPSDAEDRTNAWGNATNLLFKLDNSGKNREFFRARKESEEE